MKKMVLRSDVKLFYSVGGTDGTITRMTGFNSTPTNKNAVEYERTYTDDKQATTDVTGYNTSIDFSFDRFTGNTVHDDIINIFSKEIVGLDARRDIYEVDFASPAESGGYAAKKRTFSVICSSAGDGVGTDAMKYSGTFKVVSAVTIGTATIATPANGDSDTVETITFTPATSGE